MTTVDARTVTIRLIDWENSGNNRFAIVEEVAVASGGWAMS